MNKKNEKFFEKIVKKDYNNELEKILEKKDYSEDVKSLLLNIFYKIDAGYKDYKKVKIDVDTKEEYTEELLRIIKNKCNEIKLINPESEDKKILGNKTFLVEKKEKRIISTLLDRKILYSIGKIDKHDKIVKDEYYIIDSAVSELINVGNSIEMVEPLRDFNGYSWINIPTEMESIDHNLIYQNLRILIGNKFLKKWIKKSEFILDYYENFKSKFEIVYSKKISIEIIEKIEKIAILLMIKYNKDVLEQLHKLKNEIGIELEILNHKDKLVEDITKKKKEILKQIKKTDEILNFKKNLEKEYVERNNKLPLEKKIFSIRVLAGIIKKEREELLEEIQRLNVILNPKQFVKYKKEQEQKYKYAKITDVEDLDIEIGKCKIEIQKIFLSCLKIKLEKVETKKDLEVFIYQFRYYMLLQFNRENRVYEQINIQKEINEILNTITIKAKTLKLMENITKESYIEEILVKQIIIKRDIKLEDIQYKVIKDKVKSDKNVRKFYIEILNNDEIEDRIDLDNINEELKNQIMKSTNKKLNIFI